MARPGKWQKILWETNDITADVADIGTIGVVYDELEASGYGEDKHYEVGQGDAPLEFEVYVTTTATVGIHTIFAAACADHTIGTVTIQLGNNAAPTTGDPEFEGEYRAFSYQPGSTRDGLQTAKIKLLPSGTLPTWGTVEV